MRPDLAALSFEALAQMSNLGLAKRAARELEQGYAPAIELDADATLVAQFSDGIVMRWPNAVPIVKASCSCPAPGVCRHRLIAALAYLQQAPAIAAEPASPAEVSDDALASLIPAPLLALAAREREAGLTVEIARRGEEPCDTVRLPAATVRFWSGAAIASARCDCVRQSACEHVVLAVWAFRLASDAPRERVTLGSQRVDLETASLSAVISSLLRLGVVGGQAVHAPALSVAMAQARARGAMWIEAVLADIDDWLGAYARRSARYASETGVDLIAELVLRTSFASRDPRSALGIGAPGDVELDRLRLLCLGARLVSDGDERRMRLVLADLDTGTRLVLQHHWELAPGGERTAREYAALDGQRIAPGVRLSALSTGQLLSQRARRRADGTVVLAKARSAQNSLLPQSADWSSLSPPLRYDSVAALRAARRSQPHSSIEARHAAQSFVVFTPAGMADVGYDPNEQLVHGWAIDRDGDAVLIERAYEAHVRHALEGLAAAALGRFGAIAHIAGVLHWRGAQAVIEPWTLAADRLVALDTFVPERNEALAELPLRSAPHQGQTLLAELRAALGEMLHHGLALPALAREQQAHLAARLAANGFEKISQRLADLAAASPADVAFARLCALWRLCVDAEGWE